MSKLQTQSSYKYCTAIVVALLASACASLPAGTAPTVAVMPGGGKDMAQFNTDDIACRDDARAKSNSHSPLPVAMGLGDKIEVASTRTRLAARNSPEATGSVYGGAVAEETGTFTAQQRFDTAYVGCMYSRGHKIQVGEAMSG